MPILIIPFPMINPVAVQIGPFPLRWYALAYIAGFVCAWLFMRALVSHEKYWRPDQPRPTKEQIDDLLVYVAFGVIIGGRLGHVLIYDPEPYLAHPLDIFRVWQGGMAFHGGLLGALLGLTLFARRERLVWTTVADLCAAASPLGLFFGRLANFIRPEMWGRPSDAPWAMVFPYAGELPRHPSQLYEAGLEGLALGGALWLAVRAGALKRPGLVAGLFSVGYACARSFCELYREPDPEQAALAHGLTMGMALSAPMLIAGLILIVLSLRVRRAPA